MYSYHESFKHKIAKELLWSWLDFEDKNCDYSSGECGLSLPFNWRPNYGVYLELPFYETDDIFYFECSKGLKEGREEGERTQEKYLSWFDPSFNRGKYLFVPDITIFHKGVPHILIEVVHKSRVSEKKLRSIEKFFGYLPDIYEIESDNILCQTNKHRNLIFKQIAGYFYEQA